MLEFQDLVIGGKNNLHRLVLFDIDETMIYSDGVGRRAMEKALQITFDHEIDAGEHNMSGKTDPQICYELLTARGYKKTEIDAKLPLAFETYLQFLETEISRARSFGLHRGVVELIAALQSQKNCHLGLLTGNIEPGARLKLSPFYLNRHFHFGAFGSDSADRLDLPAIAHRRAEDFLNLSFKNAQIVIIGDAVNDILCAKGYGVKSLITATGKTSKETLEELEPDFLFDSLSDTEEIMSAVWS